MCPRTLARVGAWSASDESADRNGRAYCAQWSQLTTGRRPWRTRPTARGLAKLVDARLRAAPAKIGELRVAELQVALIAAMRSANNLKVRLLIFAIAAELIAIIFLFRAAAVILYHA